MDDIMNNYLDKLEFNNILEKLGNHCVTVSGKEIARNLLPSNSVNVVKHSLNETEEAVNLSIRNSIPDFHEIFPIDIELKKLQSNVSLSIKEILNL